VRVAEFLYLTSIAIGAGGFVIAACIVVWQSFQWVQFGYWIPVTVQDGLEWLHYPIRQFRWVGAQKIADFVYSSPLSAGAILAFLAIAWFISLLAAEQVSVDKRAALKRMREEHAKEE
jgi:hypothetical protein